MWPGYEAINYDNNEGLRAIVGQPKIKYSYWKVHNLYLKVHECMTNNE